MPTHSPTSGAKLHLHGEIYGNDPSTTGGRCQASTTGRRGKRGSRARAAQADRAVCSPHDEATEPGPSSPLGYGRGPIGPTIRRDAVRPSTCFAVAYLETLLCGISGVLAIATVFWPDWIE